MSRSWREQKVALCYPYASSMSSRFSNCLYDMLVHDAKHHRRLVDGARIANSSGANITNARNEIVELFLDRLDCEWLLFLDTDMTFEPDLVDRLVRSAHPERRPIVGALCFSLKDGVRAVPTIYVFRDDGKVGRVFDYPRDQLVQVGATGTGCLLIHRSVLEAMRERFPKPYQWFQEQAVGHVPVGEDITFCIRAGAMGFDVHVDTSIKCGHEKTFVLDEAMFLAQQASLAVELPTYVVIPFKDRHDLTGHLLESLEGYAKVLLYDNGSAVPPPPEWGAVDAAGQNLHQMWNAGVEVALAETGGACNVAILNNDLKVDRGFLDGLAAALRSDPRLVAVCPNYDGRDFAGELQLVNQICANRYDGTGGLAGFAFMVKGEWFAQGYRFPEELAWWYGDNDFVASVRAAQGLLGLVKRIPVEHVGGGGQTPRPADWDERIAADRRWFEEKWAG